MNAGEHTWRGSVRVDRRVWRARMREGGRAGVNTGVRAW